MKGAQRSGAERTGGIGFPLRQAQVVALTSFADGRIPLRISLVCGSLVRDGHGREFSRYYDSFSESGLCCWTAAHGDQSFYWTSRQPGRHAALAMSFRYPSSNCRRVGGALGVLVARML